MVHRLIIYIIIYMRQQLKEKLLTLKNLENAHIHKTKSNSPCKCYLIYWASSLLRFTCFIKLFKKIHVLAPVQCLQESVSKGILYSAYCSYILYTFFFKKCSHVASNLLFASTVLDFLMFLPPPYVAL